jgi:hypothetical protein
MILWQQLCHKNLALEEWVRLGQPSELISWSFVPGMVMRSNSRAWPIDRTMLRQQKALQVCNGEKMSLRTNRKFSFSCDQLKISLHCEGTPSLAVILQRILLICMDSKFILWFLNAWLIYFDSLWFRRFYPLVKGVVGLVHPMVFCASVWSFFNEILAATNILSFFHTPRT